MNVYLLSSPTDFKARRAQRPVIVRPLSQVGWAAFVDTAKVIRTPLATRAGWQVDLGAGLRAHLPGTQGTLRLDFARGVRDGRTALSIAWQTAWPGW